MLIADLHSLREESKQKEFALAIKDSISLFLQQRVLQLFSNMNSSHTLFTILDFFKFL